jgi:hypothetical protein
MFALDFGAKQGLRSDKVPISREHMDVRSDAAQDVPISREHMDVRSDAHRNILLGCAASRLPPTYIPFLPLPSGEGWGEGEAPTTTALILSFYRREKGLSRNAEKITYCLP